MNATVSHILFFYLGIRMINYYSEAEATETSETTESGDLNLNPEVLNNKKTQHSSLEDLYSYHVFSSEFKNNIDYVKKKENEEINSSFDKILEGEKIDNSEEVFEAVFQSPRKSVISNDYNGTNGTGNDIVAPIIFIMLGMLITVGAIKMIEKIKRKIKSGKGKE